MSSATYDQVRELAESLAAGDRLRLIADLASGLEAGRHTNPAPPWKSAFGALKDLGRAPSADEIDEARREAWAGFPREDV